MKQTQGFLAQFMQDVKRATKEKYRKPQDRMSNPKKRRNQDIA